jgi:hypothetical protein
MPALAQKSISVRTFGAQPNDNRDDQPAFQQLIKRMEEQPGNYIVSIPKGVYHLDRPLSTKGLQKNIVFKGEPGTRIVIRGHGGGLLIAASAQATLLRPLMRNQTQAAIRVPGNFRVEAGDLIHIQSNTPFETGWKYTENDIQRIAKISGNQVEFEEKALFNYDPSKEKVTVTIYKKCFLQFSNISFLLDVDALPGHPIAESTLGLKGVSADFRNVSFDYSGKKELYHLGVNAVACEGLTFNNIKLANLQYGILMNYCRNVEAFDTKATFCRHAYAPAQACYNVYIEKLRGLRCQSAMDGHNSFLVHYKDVVDSLATQLPNCRSLGTIIENTRVIMTGNYTQLYCYWSVQLLTPEYLPLYGEYDTRFSNVHWVSANPGSFNGLNSFSCRRLIVENCTTHSVAYYGDQKVLQKAEIRNSRIGVIRIDAHNAIIENTVMDGKLMPNSDYVFRFTGRGDCQINNVTVKNYNPAKTYLFDYADNVPGVNNMSITGSNIEPLKGWVKKLTYPGKPVHSIKVNESMISEFRDPLPREYPALQKEIRSAKLKYRKQ